MKIQKLVLIMVAICSAGLKPSSVQRGITVLTSKTSPAEFAMLTQRANQDGLLDATFGTGGSVTTTSGAAALALAVALQPDGKMVIAGGSDTAMLLARYNVNGTLDTTFGAAGTGKVTLNIGLGGTNVAYGIVLQPDGKIVITGLASTGVVNRIAVVRYTANGSLDTSFNTTGIVTTAVGTSSVGRAVALQPDGKIVVAGYALNAGTGFTEFAVVRYLSNGTPDSSFNGTGIVTTAVTAADTVSYALALQSDGKIVVAGSTGAPNCAIARYTSSGVPDTTFNGTGTVVTTFAGSTSAFSSTVVQSDGKIVAAGNINTAGHNIPMLCRYTAAGVLDSSFGAGTGKVTTPSGTQALTRGIVLQPDGTLLIIGQTDVLTGNNILLARYATDGSLDTSFGSAGTGIVVTSITVGNDIGYALTLQPDGKIVGVGSANDAQVALVRYINPFTLATFSASYGAVGLL